ncbi:MAG: glutathione peroxidase [Erysipelotrichaceae bacterium]
MNFYDYKAKKMNGTEVSMEEYKGDVVLVVNTATKCGLAPQLVDLESLHKQYEAKGVRVLGFPCGQFANQELADNSKIEEVCMMNYGVTFTMFEKIDVNGNNTHPLYQYLKSQKRAFLTRDIKWNFTKFLVDRNGSVVKRYAPTVKISVIEKDLQKYL